MSHARRLRLDAFGGAAIADPSRADLARSAAAGERAALVDLAGVSSHQHVDIELPPPLPLVVHAAPDADEFHVTCWVVGPPSTVASSAIRDESTRDRQGERPWSAAAACSFAWRSALSNVGCSGALEKTASETSASLLVADAQLVAIERLRHVYRQPHRSCAPEAAAEVERPWRHAWQKPVAAVDKARIAVQRQ